MKLKFKNVDARLLTILLIIFVQLVGAAMALPILPLYAQRRFALAPEIITLLVSVFFAAQFVAAPFIGRLSDRHGRLPVLIVSQIGTAISFVMLGLAQSFEVLFLARLLDGITGGNIIVAQAYVTDITPREQRTEALGYTFAAFGLGFVVGPALGGVLAALFGEQIPFLIAAAAAAVTVVITWTTLDESLSPEQQSANRTHPKPGLAPAQVIRNQPLMLILLVGAIGHFGMGLIQATFALYGEAVIFSAYNDQITNLGIGLLLAVVGMGQFFSQMFLLKRMLARYGDAMLILIGTVMRGVMQLALAMVLSPWPAVPVLVVFAIGTGLMMPPLQSLATGTVDDSLRGGVLGVYQSAASLSIIASTALGGVLFAIHPTMPYWLGGVLFLLIVVPGFVLLRWSQANNVGVSAPAVSAD